ncbi:hypothetical protein Y032_0335g2875 [Ancylostoma ceylanicum]|uniref:Uncharacterized protein n=1 Tax=Ancylostoma ceylanicum TaxID=53326 RepID=A0A016RYU3_9BILA|nr:hypothetical protein Y032_0335g2875 [Ancylostoma ceylanicum]
MSMISNETVKNPFLRDQSTLTQTGSSARKVRVLSYSFADLIDRTGVLLPKTAPKSRRVRVKVGGASYTGRKIARILGQCM